MAKSIKLGADTYLDASGVVVNNSGTTLADWMGAVKFAPITIPNQSSASFALGSDFRGVFISNAVDPAMQGFVVASCNYGANTCFYNKIGATNLSVSATGNSLTISNSTGNYVIGLLIYWRGSITLPT